MLIMLFFGCQTSSSVGSKVDLVNAAYGDAFDEFQGLREDRWVHSADAGEIWFINEEFRKSSKDILRFW